MKVIIKVGLVPLGSYVTKIKGVKRYKVLDRLRAFQAGAERQEIVASPGCVFLVSEGDANAVPGDQEVVWLTTVDAYQRAISCRDDAADLADEEDL